MLFTVLIRKIGSTRPFKQHIIDKATATLALVEAIERTMLENNEPIICRAIVPFDDYDFMIEEFR